MERLDHLGLWLLVLAMQSCGITQTPYQGTCGKTPNLELVSLAMIPDPLPEARETDQWRAIIPQTARTFVKPLGVVEAGTDKLITPELRSELSLSANEVTLFSLEDYRLSGKEICFDSQRLHERQEDLARLTPSLLRPHHRPRLWLMR